MTRRLFLAAVCVAALSCTGTPPVKTADAQSDASPQSTPKASVADFPNFDESQFETTESGLKYRILEAGEGDKPTAAYTVNAHYAGTLPDGTPFDSSYKRGEPTEFPLNRVIPGWTEGLQLIAPGGKIQLIIPPELGYGPRGAGRVIPPNATLHFNIELVSAEPPLGQGITSASFPAYDESQFTTTDSGLKYRILEPGNDKKPSPRSTVVAHYEGTLENGEEFDSSIRRGEPIPFPLNGVIAGWTEGLQLIGEGGLIQLIIPGDLAYGAGGSPPKIGPNATLRFNVALLKVR